jgi:hypothetical protein
MHTTPQQLSHVPRVLVRRSHREARVSDGDGDDRCQCHNIDREIVDSATTATVSAHLGVRTHSRRSDRMLHIVDKLRSIH